VTDPEVRKKTIEQLKANLMGRRSNVPTLEFLARLNREIGLGWQDYFVASCPAFHALGPKGTDKASGGDP
jgi:hypothetical protein